MSHPAEMNFVQGLKDRLPQYFDLQYFENKKVLEVGSLDINGSIRQLFANCEYLGIDVGAGKGVDKVISGHLLDEPDGTFAVACSCECFEHNRYWKQTLSNMHRMLKPGGLLFLTCAKEGRPEHGTSVRAANDSPYTNDYYQNLHIRDFLTSFDFDAAFSNYGFEIQNGTINDLYFWGIKK